LRPAWAISQDPVKKKKERERTILQGSGKIVSSKLEAVSVLKTEHSSEERKVVTK
jgi:hypothetical protein